MMLMMPMMMLKCERLLCCLLVSFCVQQERIVIQSVRKTVPPGCVLLLW